MVYFTDSSQASLSALLTESNVSFKSEVMLIGTSDFKQIVDWVQIFNYPRDLLFVVVHISQVAV